MAFYKIAGLITEMYPSENTLLKQSKDYLIKEHEKSQISINIEKIFLKEKQKENPHLTIDDCEYIWYGAEFYRNLIEFSGMLLHASAIAYNGKAYVFSAPSGTGKSTHTGLWKNYFGEAVSIINDDKPALRIVDGNIYVYGTPFSGKTDLNKNISVPLQAICFLERSQDNWIEKMNVEDAYFCMLNQTIRPVEEEKMDSLLDTLEKILNKTKVYKMGCNISEDAVKIACQRLQG